MSSVDTRDVSRDSLFLVVDLVSEAGGPAVRFKVRNLSAGGMMVEGELHLKRGERVAFDLRNVGPIAGTVAWVHGRKIGIAFDEQIDPKLARTQVEGSQKEAPVYARAALSAPRYDGWNGKMRRI